MKKIFVAGHNGMVGSAIVRHLKAIGDNDIIVCERDQLDLMSQEEVKAFFESQPIDQVYLAAAKVGGIYANNHYPAEFIYNNLMIACNVIHQAFLAGVKQLLFLGSSCIYPKFSPQPIEETALLSGYLEPTNEPYAIAKIAGIKLCESYNRQYNLDYRAVMPSNLYGIHDNFHPQNSHVIPALLARFHEAKVQEQSLVTVWGSGNPKREFLYVDDLASACVYLMGLEKSCYYQHSEPMMSHINVGTGEDCTIKMLAETIRDVVGFKGVIRFDASKPDGAPRKLLDVSRLNQLGWAASVSLKEGLMETYQWYLNHHNHFRTA